MFSKPLSVASRPSTTARRLSPTRNNKILPDDRIAWDLARRKRQPTRNGITRAKFSGHAHRTCHCRSTRPFCLNSGLGAVRLDVAGQCPDEWARLRCYGARNYLFVGARLRADGPYVLQQPTWL